MLDDLLQRPPSRAVLDELLARVDAEPVLATPHVPVAQGALACWTVSGELEVARTCTVHALERWSANDVRDDTIVDMFPTFEPRLHGPRSSFAPLGFELALRLDLRAVAPPVVEANFRIPPQFATWLRLAEGRWWGVDGDDPYCTKLFTHARITSDLRFELEAHRGRDADERREQDDAGAWLTIGDSGDRRTYTICCHRLGPWGEVHEWEDSHPWIALDHGWHQADDFAGYLRKLEADWLK